MWNLIYFLIATGVALLAVRALRHLWPHEPQPSPAPRARPMPPRAPASMPAPGPIPWDEPITAPPPLKGEALRERLRDRYIAARFPGIAARSADLERVDDVIRWARLCFEEEKYDQAEELLDLAIDQSPHDESLRLAQLEIAFLRRDARAFTAFAAELRRTHPQSRNWAEVARLGRAIDPGEPMFVAGPGSRPHEHYGPWPDMPNWIQASWDLTAEVLAADFHRAALCAPDPPSPAADRRASA